jgi:hypothetical protein
MLAAWPLAIATLAVRQPALAQGRQDAPPRFTSRVMIYDLDSKSARMVHEASGICS